MVERISYQDKEVDSLVRKVAGLNLDTSYYLLVLAGKNRSAKKQIVDKFKKESVEFHSVDLREIISTIEEDTYRHIDELFKNLPESPRHLYLEHADVLSGEYTGFTYSSVRYATPQEKYLLQKIKGSERIVILEMVDKANITKALERTAQTAIECDLPSGFFSKLKQLKVHGHTFENKRPADVR
ncbi:hypothetical protein [Rhodohalobacter mucosus]|uniref:Uncharacterized protein n=1 Tax=Rhodohalobacter mucosus TaxID=2079485 RepID=A0A316TQZ3_9BACT|nr:hypothetical protein [Rhodohalobacter mucosus]PWN07033.1 hypothetical protein DDZ15_07120 [Rhodohalobacter mucosus]